MKRNNIVDYKIEMKDRNIYIAFSIIKSLHLVLYCNQTLNKFKVGLLDFVYFYNTNTNIY